MHHRWTLWLSLIFLVAGCGLFGGASYLYFAPLPVPALHVAEPEIELLNTFLNQQIEIVYQLENRSGRPLRVLGLSGC